MSNIFTNNIIIYRKLERVYTESVYDTLKQPCEKIQQLISNLLDEKALEFSLKKENSVYNTKYYYIKSRVKKSDSFYEKLIRKEIGIKLIRTLNIIDLSDTELSLKRAGIVSEINRLDDVIGLRIVTELKKDCENVYKLIQNSADYFNSNQIKFIDLDGQPQTMRNGLDIYRIKAIYQDMYGFELQIKSKIDEAWGDLDHTLFYKDYSISPIKDTVQVTMNNVGELLDKIEKLLFDLRNSGGDYTEKADHLQKQMILEDELGAILKARLGVVYSLKEIFVYLNSFKETLNIIDKLVDINFDYLNFTINDSLVKSYVNIRDNSIALLILESVYVSWYELSTEIVNNENIDFVLLNYINTLILFIFTETGFEDSDAFSDYFKNLIMNSCNPHIFLKIKDHLSTKMLSDKIDAISIDSAWDNKDELKRLLDVHFFEGNTARIIEQLQEQEIEISDVLLEVKGITRNSTSPSDKLMYRIVADLLDKLAQ